MTDSLKWLPVAGNGVAPEPEWQTSEDAAAPPTVARKWRRDANRGMGVPSFAKTRTIPGWYHYPLRERPADGPESEEWQPIEGRPFALCSPTDFLNAKGITGCSQEVPRTLTSLFPAC